MRLVFNKNHGKWFLNDVLRAIKRYGMIEPRERVGVALSGGKDSTLLLVILRYLQRFSHLKFELAGLHIRAFPDDDPSALIDLCRELGVPYHEQALDWDPNQTGTGPASTGHPAADLRQPMEPAPPASPSGGSATPLFLNEAKPRPPGATARETPHRTRPPRPSEGKAPHPGARNPDKAICPVCSRLKRGALSRLCLGQRITRLAYGHHATDAAETLLMNLFQNRKLGSFSPRIELPGCPVQIIRPMIYLDERTVAAVHHHFGLPVTPFRCRYAPLNQRRLYKTLLSDLEKALALPEVPRRLVDALENLDQTNLWEHLLKGRPPAGTTDDLA